MTVPLRFSGPLANGAVITQGFDRNLWILPSEKFEQLYQRISSINIADPKARILLRLLLGQAYELAADESGGIKIPQPLREFAELDREIVLVGQGDYFEVWDKKLWQEQESETRDANANSDRFANLVISLGTA